MLVLYNYAPVAQFGRAIASYNFSWKENLEKERKSNGSRVQFSPGAYKK